MKPDLYAKIIEIAPSSEQATVMTAVREAVSLAVSQDVVDIAIALALREASLDKVPGMGALLYDFIIGPLRNTLQTFASVEESDLAVTRLLGILAPQLAKVDRSVTEVSAVRRISRVVGEAEVKDSAKRSEAPFPQDAPTRERSMQDIILDPTERNTSRPPPPIPESYSLLVFTTDLDVSFLFGVLLGSAISIETHSDLTRFVEELTSNPITDVIVVVDFRGTEQPTSALARIAPSLPKKSPVVFWGADDTLKTQFRTLIADPPEKWITCSSAVEVEDLVALIRCSV